MDFMWCQQRRPPGRRSGHGLCRDPCDTVDSDRVTGRLGAMTTQPCPTRIHRAICNGDCSPLRRRAHTATKGQWVTVGTDGRRCRHTARRMAWIWVLMTGVTMTDGLLRWAIAAAEHTIGWRDLRPVSSQGPWRLERLILSNSASGRGPADPGGVTAPGAVTSRLDGGTTGRRRENEATRNERRYRTFKNLKLTCLRRENEGTQDETHQRPGSQTWTVKLRRSQTWNWIEEASCDVARFVNRSGSPLGCDSDTTASGPQQRGRPVAFKFDSEAAVHRKEREGRRLRREQPPNRPTSPPPPPPWWPHRPQCRRRERVLYEGRVQVRALPRGRDTKIWNKGVVTVVLSRPTATRSGARASTCQICLGGHVLTRNKT